MQMNVVIDINKIDYDLINQQIKEKINSMELDKVYPINEMFRNALQSKIHSFLDQYIGKRYGESVETSKTREMVVASMNKAVEEHTGKYIDEIIEKIGEENFHKLILDIFPTVLAQFLYEKISRYEAHITGTAYDQFQNSVHNMITNTLSSTFHGY